MKIIFVCNEYPPVRHGGIGIFVKTLAIALAQSGHEVHVIGFDPLRAEDEHQLLDGVKIVWLKVPRFIVHNKLLQSLYERYYLSRRLSALSAEVRPDVVESYDWSGPLLYRPSRTKFVVRLHGANSPNALHEQKKVSRFLYFLEKRNIQMADAIAAVSNHIAKITVDCFQLNISYTVLYNPVDCEVFKPHKDVSRDQHLLLYVGRLDQRKGLEELMLAFNIVHNENPKINLELVGGGIPSYQEKLISLLTSDAKKCVSFSGRIGHDQLPKKYSRSLVAVLPSRAEAFGITAIEAMACETPVVITKRASGPEIITHRENGWVVDTFDTDSFAKNILEAFSDPPSTNNLGRKARQTVLEKFDLQKIIQNNIFFYQNNAHD